MKKNLVRILYVFFIFLIINVNVCLGLSGDGLIQDKFIYSDWNTGTAPMNSIWSLQNGNNPTIITNNPILSPSYLQLNNSVISANLGRTLTADFGVAIDILQTNYQRYQWVGIFNEAGTEGYAFAWDSSLATCYGSCGVVSIRKISVTSPANLIFNTSGTLLGSIVSSQHNPANTTSAAISAPFAHFVFTWNKDTAQLQLSVDGVVVQTVTDNSFSSFSKIYIGGNTYGLFDNLSVTVPAGANVPFITYEAETQSTSGTVVLLSGPPAASTSSPELEASGRGYVSLDTIGQYIDFPVVQSANAIVIRHSIPDAPTGGGITATLSLYVNGVKRQTLTLSSYHNWLYGAVGTNGQSNVPSSGAPWTFWDESHFFITGGVNQGDILRLEKDSGDIATFYHVDLIDLENVPIALAPPAAGTYLSVMSYGAKGDGVTDDTQAISTCIAAAQSQNKIVWFPSGTYNQSTSFTINGITVQGAGMWYTHIVGTTQGTGWGNTGFGLQGNNTKISDLSIDDAASTYRKSGGAAIHVAYTPLSTLTNFTIQNIWITHAQSGIWLSAVSNGLITGCRVMNTYADGININYGSTSVQVENNYVRGSGDDGIGFLSDAAAPVSSSNNSAIFNTVVATRWGLNFDLAGGENMTVKYNYFLDNSVSSLFGINMPPSFPMFLLNNALISRNILIRGGGNFLNNERPSMWIYPGTATITNSVVDSNYIENSFFDGIANTGSTTYSQNIIFTGNTIEKCGLNGFHINSCIGSGAFIDNSVSGISPNYTPFLNQGGSGYTAIFSGNSWN